MTEANITKVPRKQKILDIKILDDNYKIIDFQKLKLNNKKINP